AAPRGAVEIRLQIGQVDRAVRVHRDAAEIILGSAAGERIRLLGECEPRGAASALEPSQRARPRHRRAPADPDVEWLWRVRRRYVQGPRKRALVRLSWTTRARRPQSGKPAPRRYASSLRFS